MKVDSRAKPLMDKTKSKLLKQINKSPGIRYRELLRTTGFSNGVTAYHLKKLEISKRIKVSRSHSRSTRFYPLSITSRESHVIEYIRRGTTRQIVLFLLRHESSTFKEIVRFTKKVRSTVSWHLSRLRDGGIISIGRGRNQTYRLNSRDLVIRVMKKIRVNDLV